MGYLRVALSSISAQATKAGAELIVVDDAGPSEEARALAERFGARYEPHSRPLGLNVARNTGVERSTGELVVFVDDDVQVCEGWLDALLAAAGEHPEHEVFTGPILPRLEGSPPHSCGREDPPSPPWTSVPTTLLRALRGEPTWRSAALRWSVLGRLTCRSSTAATSRSGRNGSARRGSMWQLPHYTPVGALETATAIVVPRGIRAWSRLAAFRRLAR